MPVKDVTTLSDDDEDGNTRDESKFETPPAREKKTTESTPCAEPASVQKSDGKKPPGSGPSATAPGLPSAPPSPSATKGDKPKAKAKAKKSSGPKAKAAPSASSSGAMKRPAAKSQMKRPAAADAAGAPQQKKLKVLKHYYSREKKYGIKVGDHEIITATWVQVYVSCFPALVC